MNSQALVKCPRCNVNRDASGYSYNFKTCDKFIDTYRRYREKKMNQAVFVCSRCLKPKARFWLGPNLRSCNDCLVKRHEHRQRTYEQSHERVECPVCQKIITRHKLPRHMRTIKCSSYIKPEADVEAPPAVVDDPPAMVVASTAYDE